MKNIMRIEKCGGNPLMTEMKCDIGGFYRCEKDPDRNYGHVFKQGDNIAHPEGTTTIPRTYIKASVHTHPNTHEDVYLENVRRGMSAYGLRISDIDRIGDVFGLILYENDVYQYNVSSKKNNSFCSIVDTF